MEPNSQSYRDALYSQIEVAYGKVMYTYTTHIIHAGRLAKRNRRIKWLQIILSAIATGGFLTTLIKSQTISLWVGGISSTLLLIVASYIKDINFDEAQSSHINTANELWDVREKYLSLLTDFNEIETDIIVNQRNELSDVVSKIYHNAPLTDDKSYSMAQEDLQKNEAQFFSREELDQLLPSSLRKGK